MRFIRLFERYGNPVTVHVMTIRGSTAGSHGFDGDPERPAGDPLYAAWVEEGDIYDQGGESVDDKLKGFPCIIVCQQAGGSFHEKWICLEVYVEIPEDQSYLDITDDYCLSDYDTTKDRQAKEIWDYVWKYKDPLIIPYKGFKDTVSFIRSEGDPLHDPDDIDSRDRDKWWAKRIEVAKAGKARTYDGD